MSTLSAIQQHTTIPRIVIGSFVVFLAIFTSNPYPFLENYYGRAVQRDPKVKYKGHGSLNNDKCWLNHAAQSCEDVKIHHESGSAFLACGDAVGRSYYYPAINNFNPSKRKDFHEYFMKYDIGKNVTTRLEVEGWNGDLITHGIDIWQMKDDPKKIHLFAVNHQRGGDSITIFSHVLGTNKLRFVKDVKHKNLRTPNEVTPAGPLSFFISNDHYYYSGIFRNWEDKYGPWYWSSHVAYCDASGPTTTCRQVSENLQYANGVLLTEDGKTLLVNDLHEGTTLVYNVDPATKELILERKIRLGASPDNLSPIPTNGDIIVPVFPNLETLMKRGFGPGILDYGTLSEAAVIRLDKSKGYAPSLLYWDDGSLISVMTGAAVDPYHKVLLGGGAYAKAFLVCDISGDKTGVRFG